YNTTPNQFWGGTIIPGTNRGGDAAFRAYDNPVDCWNDQAKWIKSLYPISARASDVSTYANGLLNGLGNRQWTSTNQDTYASNIIYAYNEIQNYKASLGIQSNQYYANAPVPSPTTPASNFLTMSNTQPATSTATSTTSNAPFATNRTVSDAAIAQKTPIFLPI
ncbi:MAG: hypothetical protein KGI25_10135, partial [Thaumarchaeota archaeon]|nr:hypothetical protein [Nitrososphaerota archaeon]